MWNGLLSGRHRQPHQTPAFDERFRIFFGDEPCQALPSARGRYGGLLRFEPGRNESPVLLAREIHGDETCPRREEASAAPGRYLALSMKIRDCGTFRQQSRGIESGEAASRSQRRQRHAGAKGCARDGTPRPSRRSLRGSCEFHRTGTGPFQGSRCGMIAIRDLQGMPAHLQQRAGVLRREIRSTGGRKALTRVVLSFEGHADAFQAGEKGETDVSIPPSESVFSIGMVAPRTSF